MIRWTWMLGVVLGFCAICQAVQLSPEIKEGSQGATNQSLEKKASELEQECQRIAKRISDSSGLNKSDAERKSDEDALSQAVLAAFEVKQKLHRDEVIEFEKKLGAMKQRLQDREQNREDIVKRRIQELVQSSNSLNTSESDSVKALEHLPNPISPKRVKLDQVLTKPVVLEISHRTVSSSTLKPKVSEQDLIESIRDTSFASFCAIKTLEANVSLDMDDRIAIDAFIRYEEERNKYFLQRTAKLLKPGPDSKLFPITSTSVSYVVDDPKTGSIYNGWGVAKSSGRLKGFGEAKKDRSGSDWKLYFDLPTHSWLANFPKNSRDSELWKTRFSQAKYRGTSTREDGLEYVTLEFPHTPINDDDVAKSKTTRWIVRVDFAKQLGFYPISNRAYELLTELSEEDLNVSELPNHKVRLCDETQTVRLYSFDDNGHRIVFPCKIENKPSLQNPRTHRYEVKSLQINGPINQAVFSPNRVREELSFPEKTENEIDFKYLRGTNDSLDFDDVAVTFQVEQIPDESKKSQFRMRVTNCGERSFQGMELRLQHGLDIFIPREKIPTFDRLESSAGKYDAESRSILIDGFGELKKNDSMTFDFTCIAADDNFAYFHLAAEIAQPSKTKIMRGEFFLPRTETKH